jgi:integrase
MRQDEAMKGTLHQVCDSFVQRPGKLKDGTAVEVKRYVDKAFAAWKDKPIASITRDMVRDRHREILEGALNGKRAAPAAANSAMVILRTLINFAADEYRRSDGSPLISDNPVSALKHHWAKTGDRTQRYIDKRKVGEVWNALHEARANPKNRDALAGIDLTIFLMLTGARRMEGAALTWDRINIDDEDASNCWWHLPNPKNGKAVWLPLSSQAVALLKLRPKVKDADGNDVPFVFPSRSKVGHITDTRAPMEMVSEVAGKTMSAHDLRRTFTNIAMRECLIEKFRTDLLTNHVPDQADVTARNYLDLARLDWLQPEAQKIGDWIEEQGRVAAAIAASKNVVQLAA